MRIESLKPRHDGKGYEIKALLGHAELRALDGELKNLGIFPANRMEEDATVLTDGEEGIYMAAPSGVEGNAVKRTTMAYKDHAYIIYKVRGERRAWPALKL